MEEIVSSNPEIASDFDALYKVIIEAYLHTHNNVLRSKRDLLTDVFYLLYKSELTSEKYGFPQDIIKQFDEGNPLPSNVYLFDRVFYSCLFMSLCLFLHNKKRTDSPTTKAFLNKHTNDADLKECFEYIEKNKGKSEEKDDKEKNIKKAEDKFRQIRNRILSQREVYIQNKAWSAMRKDQEFEWALYTILDDENFAKKYDPKIVDTFKRLGNLNNDIYNLLQSDPKTFTLKIAKDALDKYYS
ncbi:MAG: hypothetical protein NC401_19330, partial [Ruminococcus sp.]|nr:hypothetical protein [Ruminococcus sp.]